MNRLRSNIIIKLSFFFFLNALIVADCKEKVDLQKEAYKIPTNHYIKLFNYPNSSLSKFSIEGGSNTHVVFYKYNKIELSKCNDCGNPFIALKIDPSVSVFNYTSSGELKNAHAIRGQTSRITHGIDCFSNSFGGRLLNKRTATSRGLSLPSYQLAVPFQ